MNELTINLKLQEKSPLYEQIYLYIKKNIQNGQITYGEKLPSTRALSRHLEVSRSTVELAYEQLLSEGYIEAKPCRGFFVAQIEGLYRLERTDTAKEQKKEIPQKKYAYDFTPNGVDLNSFPYNVWRKLSREILVDDRTELFRTGNPQGEESFRKAICDYLYQARGVTCLPEQIIVGAGSDYLMMLLCTIIGRERIIAVENPTYKQAYRLFLSQSYPVLPIDMDKSGMEVEKLKKTGADIAYVTPSHQYPTGIVMPMKRRMELLMWANEKEGRYIIEDDYDSEFRYKGKPIPALQGYDAGQKVVYLGTFSKSIAPAIRLSYMVLPLPLLAVYEKKCRFLNSTVSKVDQLIVQHFIEDGYYERHLNKTRALYKSRHDALINGLKPLADISRMSGEHAGVHLLLTFENGMQEEELIERAEYNGIRVYGLSDYIIGKQERTKPTVLLGYANLSEEKIKEACKILCEIWR
ncbi:MAG: PLP-dependent aminotransferase family protein [Lachnoclostridium sp.]